MHKEIKLPKGKKRKWEKESKEKDEIENDMDSNSYRINWTGLEYKIHNRYRPDV